MKISRKNTELVEFMQKRGMVHTPSIIEAFRAVDRGEFASPISRQDAFLNRPFQQGDIHLSAPFIYAEALEVLKLKPGKSFLNIGSGTCYLSYLASMLIGEMGVNHGVEISKKLVGHSARCVAATDARLGRKTDIQVQQGNGMNVAADLGYDCIYVGAGCDLDKTLAYLQDLLNVGGVMVAPFGDELVRMERKADGSFSSHTLCNVCFSPIVMPAKIEEGAPTPPAVRFVVRPWSPECHSVYPASFKETVMTVLLMANNRERALPAILPPQLWMEIMSFARRDWFSESARLHEREVKTLADVVAKGKSRIASARGKKAEGRERGGAAASSSSPNTSGYLGAAKSVALMPVKAGNAAATQIGCHVS